MKPLVSMRTALADPHLLGTILPGPTWLPHRSLLIASMGEALTSEERAAFTKLTGRDHEPMERCEEVAIIAGRRGGKTQMAATKAIYLSTCCDYSDVLTRGERGVCLFLAQNSKQAEIAFARALGILESVPDLAELIVSRTSDTIRLSTRVDLEIRAASFRGLRGLTAIACLADEVAFWQVDLEGANPDSEILAAVRPSLVTTGGPMILLSSPYGKRGELYEVWSRHFGPNGDRLILVARGTSRELNPNIKQSTIDRAFERDPISAKSEWDAQWRDDSEAFISRATVEALVDRGVYERPFVAGQAYVAFLDQSLGMQDSFVISIWHLDRTSGRPIEDYRAEWRPPFSPAEVCGAAARIIRSYGLSHCVADKVGGMFVVEMMSKFGVSCEQTALPKSELYLHALALMNSGMPSILDVREGSNRAIDQFCNLERRVGRMGAKDAIDHPPGYGKHDDVANALAGGMVTAVSSRWGWNWGAYFESWRGEARTVPPGERDANNPRPWRGSEPSKPQSPAEEISEGAQNLKDIYAAVRTGGLAAMVKLGRQASNDCATCGKAIGATYSTDGIVCWHPECGPPPVQPVRDKQSIAIKTRVSRGPFGW